jgi:hypothetical protein
MSKPSRKRKRLQTQATAPIAGDPAAPGRRHWRGALVGVLGVAVAAAAIWFLARPVSPAQVSAPPPSATLPDTREIASRVATQCTVAGAMSDECLRGHLDSTLKASGEVTAFAVLGSLSKSGMIDGRDHALAHHLGRVAYGLAGAPAQALADCPATMGSGCLHGVVEAYFEAKGPDASILGLCSFSGPGASHATHQCWHGVGHGVYMARGDDWAGAVTLCATISEYMDRVNCSSGVFMQNLMNASVGGKAGAMAGMAHDAAMPGMQHTASATEHLRPNDLLYPCNAVRGEEATIGCWQQQAFAVLKLTRGAFDKAFWACSRAGVYAIMCEEGVGQAAGAQSRRDHQPPLGYCELSTSPTAKRHCLVGVIKDVVMTAHSLGPGLELCRTVDADAQSDCYGAVGVMNRGFESRRNVRLANCASVADPFRAACAAL